MIPVYQTIFDGAITPITAQMQAMIGPMCAAMQPIGLALIGIWLVFALWDLAMQAKTVMQIGKQMFTAALFYSMLWVGQYTQYITNLFLQDIPNTISAALGGNATPVAQLDQLLTQASQQAMRTYEAVPAYSFKVIALSIGVLVFLVVALVCVTYMFIVMTVAAVVSMLTLTVGPVFIAAATIPYTRKFASGWLSVMVGGVVTQLLAVALIRLLTGASNALMARLAVSVQASGSNSIGMLWGLASLGILLFVFMHVTKKIPELAQTIGGGIYHGSNSAMAATLGAATAAGAAAVGAVAGGVGGGIGGAVAGARATGTASGGVLGMVSGAASGAAQGAGRGFRYAAPAAASLSRRRR
jgi:type IV secretory pathway VirB6-like protein